jgi:peptide/nickel transport system substrate-binding protein
MTFPSEITVPIRRDILAQAPDDICHFGSQNRNINLIVNRDKPPFDNPDVRRAMALALDRRAFITILAEGNADIGGALLPPPQGIWGMPPEMVATMSGYGPDIAANRAEARTLMAKAGYGPGRRLAVKVSARNIPVYRDPAVILIDHLREVYIDGELDPVDSSLWFAKVARKDYAVGLNVTANALDDPDQTFYENFGCGSERNYSGYCSRELETLFDRQSAELDPTARRRLVWQIDRQLHEDVARPVIFHMNSGTCWHPYVHGYTPMVNSALNGYRFEDVWLDR